jgi:hypothetical protein
MATSKKSGDGEFYSRRRRGYRTQKFPKGFNRWGSPIHCGIREVPGGAECGAKAEYLGMCDHHADQRIEQIRLERDERQVGKGGGE